MNEHEMVAPKMNLRTVADMYEQNQRFRIEAGERIRAVVQGRDDVGLGEEPILHIGKQYVAAYDTTVAKLSIAHTDWTEKRRHGAGIKATVQLLLDEVERGDHDGPIPLIGRAYRRHAEGEREAFAEMSRSLADHPAWPWLSQVKGIGATLACKVLARLDIDKAPHPSSFWKHAGLATVPAHKHHCSVCGRSRNVAVGSELSPKHQALGSSKTCSGAYEVVAGPDDGVRAAQKPQKREGGGCGYDPTLKKTLLGDTMVATQLIMRPNPYRDHYDRVKARYATERPDWPDGRVDRTAKRIMVKLLLAHLWETWSVAVGRADAAGPNAYVFTHLGHDRGSYISPWAMVDAEKQVAA